MAALVVDDFLTGLSSWARLDGELLSFEFVIESGLVGEFRCPSCDAALSTGRSGFEHLSGSCPSPLAGLHDAAIEVIAASLADAMRSDVSYLAPWRCGLCLEEQFFDLASPSGSLVCDRVWEGGFRPDILLRTRDGEPFASVEVVVSHDVSEELAEFYRRSGLPLVRVWPSWTALDGYRTGLPAEGIGKPPVSVHAANQGRLRDHGVVVENLSCTAMRHPDLSAVPCTTCSAATTEVAFEVTYTACYRCSDPVPVLDLLLPTARELRRLLPSNPEVPAGIAPLAALLGVDLRLDESRTAGTSYLMHHCPSCGTRQGNFYLGSGLDGPNEVDIECARPVYRVCASGHWTQVRVGRWPLPKSLEDIYDDCSADPECFDDYGPCGRCPRRRRFEGGEIDWG